MQTYLPLIENMLAEWYVFTLNNPVYAAALAIAVWLLTSTFYSIRISALKRRINAGEKKATESLNSMQQQLQQSQEALVETVEQMEQAQRAAKDEAQKALAAEQLIYQRNQQIAGTIQMLATNLDLGERPQLATEDVKAEAVWQQHDKVVANLVERLRTEQRAKAELQQASQTATAKLAEKESLLKTLQTALDSQTGQLAKLEQALAEQKSILQQHSDNQQAFADALKNFQPVVVTAPAQPEPVQPVTTWQAPARVEPAPVIENTLTEQASLNKELEELPEEPQIAASVQIEEAPVEPVAPIATAEPVQPEIVPEPISEIVPELPSEEKAQTAVAEKNGTLGKFKSLFGRQSDAEAQQSVAEEPIAPAAVKAEPVFEEPAEAELAASESSKSSFGKMKNLFGKKAQPVKTEPQWEEEIKTPEPAAEQRPEAEATESKSGKLKGLYSKFASKNK
ncbi:MAG: hypothetical protein ACXWF8_15525 [Methylobacter sp.]